ncbi:unnamed protein product [Linum trigynum]|uniref:Uncharacterized protein n=1 Tax=Linum trigynum TaxID=586398 RepID=A0AAV2EUD3_9ROSI
MFGGGGGSVYWGRRRREFKGIVVIFAWVSAHPGDLRSLVDLYSSLGWNSLVSHADFLTAFYPERAISLAFLLLSELVQELRVRPCPVVFVALSGGSKACMSKVFQIIQGSCEGHLNLDESRLIGNCFSGHIYDSSPVDFTSDLAARFALPAIQKMPGPSKLMSWFAKGVTSGLDGLYLTRFEYQRTQYWQNLYSSVELGAPYLILCSADDEVASCNVICEFKHKLQVLGADVALVKLNASPHLGHYKYHPTPYSTAVTNLLEKATSVYCQRIQQLQEGLKMDGMHHQISNLVCDLQQVAVDSNEGLRRVPPVLPNDDFFGQSSSKDQNNKESESPQDERKENSSINLSSPPRISPHGVLGQVLFDACVPKYVDGWDIRFSGCLNGQPVASASKRSHLQALKRFRRSRL